MSSASGLWGISDKELETKNILDLITSSFKCRISNDLIAKY